MARRTAFALVVAVVAAACGSAGSSPVVVDDLNAIADATASAETARMIMTVEMGDEASAWAMSFEGVVDLAENEMQGTLSMSSDDAEASEEGVAGAEVEYRIVDGTTYVRGWPQLGAERADTWVRTDTSSMDLATDLALGAGSLAEPGALVETLRGAADVTDLGVDELRGVRVTGVTGTVDVAPASANAPRPASTAQVEVWVDDELRVRRLVLTHDPFAGLRAERDGGSEVPSASITSTLELFDFGVVVDVAPPPAADVIDLEEVMHQLDVANLEHEPAPSGPAPSGLPDGFPTGIPFPEGAELVATGGDAGWLEVTLHSRPEGDPNEWGERLRAMYQVELWPAWRLEGGSSSSESQDASGTTSSYEHELEFGDGERSGRVTIAWTRGDEHVVVTVRVTR